MVNSKKAVGNPFTGLFLLVLRLVVYCGSSFLAKVVLSLYGLIHSWTVFPKNRVSAAKSLLRYGVAVIQTRLGSTAEV
jgi:hypothetical protein